MNQEASNGPVEVVEAHEQIVAQAMHAKENLALITVPPDQVRRGYSDAVGSLPLPP
jgi:hypothetical protein